MIKLENNRYAIRSIISSNVDCKWGEVATFLDYEDAYTSIKDLYEGVIFVDEIDDTFELVDNVRVSGRLNMIYDPDYSYNVELFYSTSKEVYSIQIEK